MKNEKFEGEFEILGHKIRLENIKNPYIVKAIKQRANNFLFNYTDGRGDSGHTDKGSHTDNITRSYGDYSERSSHSDIYSRSSSGSSRSHTDYTDHTESHWDNYQDCIDLGYNDGR